MITELSKEYKDLVQGQTIDYVDEFTLESGKTLLTVPVAYKTCGKLNGEFCLSFPTEYDVENASNAIIVCHALSGSCDVEDWYIVFEFIFGLMKIGGDLF